MTSTGPCELASPSGLVFNRTDLPIQPDYPLRPGLPSPDSLSFLRHSFVQTNLSRDRISNLLSISYASQPRLRPSLTLGGLSFPRNPWTYGECVSHTLLVTHAGILSSLQSTEPCRFDFTPQATLPYRFDHHWSIPRLRRYA